MHQQDLDFHGYCLRPRIKIAIKGKRFDNMIDTKIYPKQYLTK